MIRRVTFWAVLLLTVWGGVNPAAAAPMADGIVTPAAGATLHGSVAVAGMAQGPDFTKWQLDLLPGHDAEHAVWLGVGEMPAPTARTLLSFDSTRLADGPYTLRLRVVHRDGNYDEFFTPVTIANAAATPPTRSATPRPAGSHTAPPRLVDGRAAALGLATHTAAGQPIIYLTFDDGPSPRFTSQIVELLGRYNAKATFCVVGLHLRRAPTALRPVVAAGHTLANHTFSHKSLAGRSQEAVAQEVRTTEELVRAAVGDLLPDGFRLTYLRPPGGSVDANTGPYAAALGYRLLGWDIDPKDWRQPGANAIAARVIQRAFPGAIVLLHDGGGDRQQTVTAVGTILEELSRQGYVFYALP